MRKQHEHGNFYRRPIPETMTGEEFVAALDDLERAGLLMSDDDFLKRKCFVQDVDAVQTPAWKINGPGRF
jgi:hypothetical protein